LTQIDAYKKSFTIYTSGGFAPDSDLVVVGVAGAVYRFEAVISYWSSTAGTDLDYVFELSGYGVGDTPFLYAVATTQGGTFNYQPLSSAAGSNSQVANNPIASTNYGLTLTGMLDLSACANNVTVQAEFQALNHTQINVNAGSQIVLTSL
jgi:hypothetical protein